MSKPLTFNGEAARAAAAAAAPGSGNDSIHMGGRLDHFRGHPGCLQREGLLCQQALPVMAVPPHHRGTKEEQNVKRGANIYRAAE